jgi:probable aminopeptidase NPEPL1
MKDDMHGSASVLGAFQLLAAQAADDPARFGLDAPVVAALALAENCIGPAAYRPDDIVTMH